MACQGTRLTRELKSLNMQLGTDVVVAVVAVTVAVVWSLNRHISLNGWMTVSSVCTIPLLASVWYTEAEIFSRKFLQHHLISCQEPSV